MAGPAMTLPLFDTPDPGPQTLSPGAVLLRGWARAQAEAAGKPMAAFDSLIAATALEHGLAVVTRNVSDFANAPVVLINPWDTVPGAQ